MKTDRLKRIVLEIVRESRGNLVARGKLYSDAQRRGYTGSQERLLACADLMALEGKIFSQKAGMAQYIQYRSIKSAHSAARLPRKQGGQVLAAPK